LSTNVEALILKENGFLVNAHLLWKSMKEKFSEIIAAQDLGGADCLAKLVRPVGQIGQAGLAKTTGSRFKRRKRHRSNEESISQTNSLSSASHGKCLMVEDKKKKKAEEG
jgi:hypothetical protein